MKDLIKFFAEHTVVVCIVVVCMFVCMLVIFFRRRKEIKKNKAQAVMINNIMGVVSPIPIDGTVSLYD